jgi:TrpR-related protein YerC/YecD
MSKWDNKITGDLIEAFLALRSKTEAKQFLRDLMTPQEMVEFSKRWQTAQMLSNKVSYVEIEKKTGLSSTTIARVSQWLNKGMGGYQLMLKRLASHHHLFPAKRLT